MEGISRFRHAVRMLLVAAMFAPVVANAQLRIPNIPAAAGIDASCAVSESQYWQGAERQVAAIVRPYYDHIEDVKAIIGRLDSQRTWYGVNPSGDYGCVAGHVTTSLEAITDTLDNILLREAILRNKGAEAWGLHEAVDFIEMTYNTAICALKTGIGAVANNDADAAKALEAVLKGCAKERLQDIGRIVTDGIKDDLKDRVTAPNSKDGHYERYQDYLKQIGELGVKAGKANIEVAENCRALKDEVTTQKNNLWKEIERTRQSIEKTDQRVRERFAMAYYEKCGCAADRERWVRSEAELRRVQADFRRLWGRPEVIANYAARRGEACVRQMTNALACNPPDQARSATCKQVHEAMTKGGVGQCEKEFLDAQEACSTQGPSLNLR